MTYSRVFLVFAFAALCLSSVQCDAPKLKFQFFVESLCKDCIAFTLDSLGPSVQSSDFWKMVDVQFYPYGNAKTSSEGVVTCQHGELECYGNKILACGSHLIENQVEIANFNVCFETSAHTYKTNLDLALSECGKSKAFNISAVTIDAISKCAKSDEANDLIRINAQVTDSLVPAHTYVPWVVVDGVHTEEMNDEVIDNIFKYACTHYADAANVESCQYFVPSQPSTESHSQ